MTSATARRPPTRRVQHNQTFDFEQLMEEAGRLLRNADYTQRELADELGVTRGAVAKAVTKAGPKFQKLQSRIIEHLSDYTVRKEVDVTFRTLRKDRAGD